MIFVCPRDHSSLERTSIALTCEYGHRYPIVGGIPIFLLREAHQTHPEADRALDEAEATRELVHDDGTTPPPDILHPEVRAVMGATSGHLYFPIRNRIQHYPIPDIRVPAASRKEHFLDIGCNWGRWSIAAATRGYTVAAIDPSFGSLVVARHVFRQLSVDVTLACADARFLPFPPNYFDIVYSYSVLQHLCRDDVHSAMSEIARTMKPGAKSLIQMPNAFGLRSLYHQARRRFRAARAFEVRYWTPREILESFSRNIGPSALTIDGFFGLGIQAADKEEFLFHHRIVVEVSEFLRRKTKWLTPFADSLFVESTKSVATVG